MAAAGVALKGQTVSPVSDGFNPNPNGIVNSIAVQPDGKILLGGYFTQFQPDGNPGSARAYLARVNHDGSVDMGFTAGTNDVVRTLLLQPNGQILVAGDFTSVQPTGGSAVTRNYAARFNADGTLDTTFNPNVNGVVYALAYQPNGQVIIGGSFTTVQAPGATGPTTRNHIARFNLDGSLDTTFDPNTDKPVLSIAVEPTGQIVVGGGFSTLQPNGAASASVRNGVARINSDGSLDTTFDPEANGSVMAITILPSGQILLGGQFTTFQANGAAASTQCDFLARLNTDGSLDTSFIINPLGYVSSVAVQADGKVLIAGVFTSVFAANSASQTALAYAARINTDGSLDTAFSPDPDQAVNAVAVQSDGEVLLGGFFESMDGVPRNFLARVGPDGSPDATFAPDFQGGISAAVTASNGQIYIGGTFLTISGITQSFLARLNADGSFDQSFTPVVNGPVQAIALQSNGQILIGGAFTGVDNIPRSYMARLNTDGSVDGPFNPSPNGQIGLIVPQSNGQILISGSFSVLTPNGVVTGIGISNLARLNADGSVDMTYDPNPSGPVFAMVAQSNGDLLIAGEFTTLGAVTSVTRSYVARLLPSGDVDTAFDPEANAPVYAIALQSDGKVLIGGAFTSVQPQTGKIATPITGTGPYGTQVSLPVPGTDAETPIYINHLARLLADGELDLTYYPDPDLNVQAIAIQSDGTVIVGGVFTSFAPYGAVTGILRNNLAKLGANGTIDPTFNPDANGGVSVIELLSGGEILVAGSFTSLQPDGASSPTPETHIAILNADGTVNPSLTGGATVPASGQVNALVLQPNGQTLVAGTFSAFGGSPASYLALFNPDGAATSFDAQVNGPVNALSILPSGASTSSASNTAVWLESNGSVRYSYAPTGNGDVLAIAQQPDGKVIVGGSFGNFSSATGTAYLVRLNTDGTVDTTFNPVSTLGAQVNAILVLPSGQIVIGGSFTNLLAGMQISYLARLNSDGSLDDTFQPSPNLDVTCLALQSNGQILVGGFFTGIEIASGTTNAAIRNYLARINADGTLDTSFNPDPNGAPSAIIVLSSGQMIVGGDFSTVQPNLGSTVYTLGSLIRLNSDGTPDTTFDPDPTGPVAAIALQPNGQIIVGGSFGSFQPNTYTAATGTTVAPIATGSLARINTDGSLDTTFYPYPNSPVNAITVLPNGEIVVGGSFTAFQPANQTYSTSRFFIARLESNGSVDPSFDPELNGSVTAIQLLADGSLFVGGTFTSINTGASILIGGSFSTIGGTTAVDLARLNADSTVDTTFTSNTDGPVYAITQQSNGQILVGGSFANVGGTARSNVARLNADGSLDAAFNPGANATVDAMAVQPNGQVVLGGAFTSVGGQPATYLARVSSSGAPDASFTPAINGTIDSVVLQSNGQILIGGAFTSVNGQPVGGIARLNADGTVDPTFNPDANGTVQAISVEADGTILVGGTFTSIGGTAMTNAARLSSSGTVDTTFAPNPNAPVDAVMVQTDGKIILGGSFSSVGGLPRYEIARLSTATQVTQSLTTSTDETVITWTRTGGAPTFSSVLFEESTDGAHWTTAGQATAINSMTWQLTGAAPVGSPLFLLRATGIMPSSGFSSSGLVQTIASVDLSAFPAITSASGAAGSSGTSFLFAVTASRTPTSYSATGLPAGLAINSLTGVISGTPASAGTYSVAVTASNAYGSTTSSLVITIGGLAGTSFTPAINSASNRLLNLSCRAELSGSNTLIAGFVITGTGQQAVLLRAVGPGLAPFLTGTSLVATPVLQLYLGNTLIAQNTGWGGGSTLAAAFAQVGAFGLASNSADDAILTSLAPGAYTIHVYDPSGVGGVVLAEIYNASPTPMTDPTRMVDISLRGPVSPGAGALIGGFVISGNSTKSVLIRGVGPGLGDFNVTGWIADPVLSVYDKNGTLVAQNFNWGNQIIAGPYQDAIGPANIFSMDATVGAFVLSPGDTALIVDLPPGAYTFQVTSASNAQGQAVGEVYELP